MDPKNRDQLKSYFVTNAIPTQDNFAALINSQLNQADDGVFKTAEEPLSVVAAPGRQKRALRLYERYPASNPDWVISLNPAQDPADPLGTSNPGFGITDGSGQTRLFVEAGRGRVGVGTNAPQATLEVAGDLRVEAVDANSMTADALTVGGSVEVKENLRAEELELTQKNGHAVRPSVMYANEQDVLLNVEGKFCIHQVTSEADPGATERQKSEALEFDAKSGILRVKTAYYKLSDLRLKQEIEPIQGALDKVLALRGVCYRRHDIDGRPRDIGLIAQEVESVFPEVVAKSDAGPWSISYDGLVAPAHRGDQRTSRGSS